MKNNSSSCNTPRKLTGHTAERTSITTNQPTTHRIDVKQMTCGDDDGTNSNRNIARDLFTSNDNSTAIESSKSNKMKMMMHELMKSPQQLSPNYDNDTLTLCTDYSNFTNDLKTPSTPPAPIGIRRLSAAEQSFHTPNKSSTSSIFTSTPSFKQNTSHASNRTGNSNSRHSLSIRSNDSRSFDDSLDASPVIKHEKSKDRRNIGNASSTLCLGDFITTTTSKQSQKVRKSLNSSEHSANERSGATPNEKDFPSFTPKGKINRISLISSTSSQSDAIPALVATPKSNYTVKPKKRVLPTRIGTNSNEFNCPAFRSDNNILELPHEECADSARDLLKSQKDMIRRVFQEERPVQTTIRAFLQENFTSDGKGMTIKQNLPALDLNKITNKFVLDKFIDIYSTIVDLNLITNILTEFSYLVNLINVDVDEYYERNPHMVNCNSISNDRTNAIESTALKQINAVGDGGGGGVGGDGGEKSSLLQQQKQNVNKEEMNSTHDKQDEQHQQPQPQQNQNVPSTSIVNELSTCVTVDNMNDVDINTNTVTIAYSLLKNINNCVYFGLGVLQLQRSILHLLDITSIKVLLENERLTTLAATIKDDLMKVYSHKMQLERSLRSHDTSYGGSGGGDGGAGSLFGIHNSSMKVFYQQEQDTQINFPSVREFGAFKKQRDTFYSILGYVLRLFYIR